ncbi:Uncharacterised protein [Mycobacterium tuberculosis]|uniref:Uncharacterized protein n=2 Tax=Mycobacterium tuberculosis TaxID=1773 RepID=A0A655J324_MYCTX|nr:Uncharacterised protein [Mycobacterium tuberculosis]CNL51959.1 Uncharacterised protein [Mycobacterium tuberculosis]COW38770.1 Uncharacterised protein [Mycobacterium tuberculosis]COX68035.1 Uncharacterised protein [Mycobacterium tuberculosis]
MLAGQCGLCISLPPARRPGYQRHNGPRSASAVPITGIRSGYSGSSQRDTIGHISATMSSGVRANTARRSMSVSTNQSASTIITQSGRQKSAIRYSSSSPADSGISHGVGGRSGRARTTFVTAGWFARISAVSSVLRSSIT